MGDKARSFTLFSKLTPPYLSFRKFYSFLKDLKNNRSYSDDIILLNETGRSEDDLRLLFRALSFFDLITQEGKMTAAFQLHLQSSSVSQKMQMQQWIVTSYPPELFKAIAEKDGSAINAALPDHLSENVKNRCMAFLRNFAGTVGLDLSAVSGMLQRSPYFQSPPAPTPTPSAPTPTPVPSAPTPAPTLPEHRDVRMPETSPSWTETILPLGWGDYCILKHNGPLSMDQVERLKKGLDMLTGVDVFVSKAEHQPEGRLRFDIVVTDITGSQRKGSVRMVLPLPPLDQITPRDVHLVTRGRHMLPHQEVTEAIVRYLMEEEEGGKGKQISLFDEN